MASLMIHKNFKSSSRIISHLNKIYNGCTNLTSNKLAACALPSSQFAFRNIHVSSLCSNIRYTQTHEWIKSDGNEAVIGITDYAQEKLGEIVFCELPEVGSKYEKGECFATIESVKAASDLYIPVTCEIIEQNPELEGEPQLINTSPYSDGWLVKVRVEASDMSGLDSLLDEKQYEKEKEQEE